MQAKSIEDLIAEAHEKMANEKDLKTEGPVLLSTMTALRQMVAYKKWYCKKNQPKNFLRITRIIPPQMEDRPFFWIQKLQVWSGQKLIIDDHIDTETFDHISKQEGWVSKDSVGMSSYIWKNPLAQ